MTLINILNTKDIVIPLISIPTIDLLLCIIFGSHTRWFQLHAVINGVIVSIIYEDVINLYIDPIKNQAPVSSQIDCYFIIFLHIYHLFISKNITFMDYFHHILFIGAGFIPAFLLYNSNLVRLASFDGCGITGCLEYTSLALVKHNKIHMLTQKKFASYLYNYIRYPLSLYSMITIYIVNTQCIITNIHPLLLVYVNFIIFFNGSFYNKLTIENYIIHRENNKYKELSNLN